MVSSVGTIGSRKEKRTAWFQALQDLRESCDIVVSAPGTFFFAGEKAIVTGAPATCMRMPRRVYVGLKKAKTSAAAITLGRSLVLTGIPDPSAPRAEPWDGKGEAISFAMSAVASAYRALTGSEIGRAYKVEVLSEWRGAGGLGWSGAFSAALAGALLLAEDKIRRPENWSKEEVAHGESLDFDLVMRLGWCVETIMHGRRASGSAVCGSLLSTKLPYLYGVPLPTKSSMPLIAPTWDPNEMDPDKKRERMTQACADPATFEPFKRGSGADYWYSYLLPDLRADSRNDEEIEISEHIFTTRQISLLQTGVSKSTAAVNEVRANSTKWVNKQIPQGDDSLPLKPLKIACEAVRMAMEEIVTAASTAPVNYSLIEERWNDLCDLTNRVHGLLCFYGLGFPIGEAMRGQLLQRFGESSSANIGIKMTGGGSGGNLLIVASASTGGWLNVIDQVVSELRDEYSRSHATLAPVQIVYSTEQEDAEPHGLVVVKA